MQPMPPETALGTTRRNPHRNSRNITVEKKRIPRFTKIVCELGSSDKMWAHWPQGEAIPQTIP